jgi:hypothetical protein
MGGYILGLQSTAHGILLEPHTNNNNNFDGQDKSVLMWACAWALSQDDNEHRVARKYTMSIA